MRPKCAFFWAAIDCKLNRIRVLNCRCFQWKNTQKRNETKKKIYFIGWHCGTFDENECETMNITYEKEWWHQWKQFSHQFSSCLMALHFFCCKKKYEMKIIAAAICDGLIIGIGP